MVQLVRLIDRYLNITLLYNFINPRRGDSFGKHRIKHNTTKRLSTNENKKEAKVKTNKTNGAHKTDGMNYTNDQL